MEHFQRADLKYLPLRCPFLKKEVWAILTKEQDGGWRIVNCLDKDRVCFEQDCAFTNDGGRWPFEIMDMHSANGKQR